jgi:hypothetical protein
MLLEDNYGGRVVHHCNLNNKMPNQGKLEITAKDISMIKERFGITNKVNGEAL